MMDDLDERMVSRFKYLIIPRNILADQTLTAQEKILVSDIDSFGEYWKTNDAISRMLSVEKRQVQRIIKRLVDNGIITVRLVHNAAENGGSRRVLRVTEEFSHRLNVSSDLHVTSDASPMSHLTCPPCQIRRGPHVTSDAPPMSHLTPKNTYENTYKNTYERENASHHRSPAFIKPTLSEVEDYVRERGFQVDSEAFYDYYESNGWRVGKNKMKKWKNAVSQWNRRAQNYGTSGKYKFTRVAQKNTGQRGRNDWDDIPESL